MLVGGLPLRLETIYGGGPAQCPNAYEAKGADLRNRLRMGETKENAHSA